MRLSKTGLDLPTRHAGSWKVEGTAAGTPSIGSLLTHKGFQESLPSTKCTAPPAERQDRRNDRIVSNGGGIAVVNEKDWVDLHVTSQIAEDLGCRLHHIVVNLIGSTCVLVVSPF